MGVLRESLVPTYSNQTIETYITISCVPMFLFKFSTARLRIEMLNHTETTLDFHRYRLIAIPEICAVLWHCNIENLLISHELMFLKTDSKTRTTLEQFENLQLKHIFKVKNYILII